MRNVWTIAKREYKLYFASPIAYILGFVILLALGGYFFLNILYTMNAFGQVPPPGVQVITSLLAFLLVFICPAVTMRTISEEARTGTLELMLTAPVRDWELVFGKWLGGFLFLLSIIAITWIYPIILNFLVEPGIDQGPLVSGYLGILLLAGAFLGVGVMISSFVTNQVATYLLTFGVLFIFWYILRITGQVLSAPANEIFYYLDMSGHIYDNLLGGVIDLTDVVYYVSITALTIFTGSMAVEMRRWR